MGLPKYSVSERLPSSVVWLVIFLSGVRVLCKLSFFVFSCKKDFVSVVSGFVVVTVGSETNFTYLACVFKEFLLRAHPLGKEDAVFSRLLS